VAAYERVPASSSLYLRAQIGLVVVLIDLHDGTPGLDELSRAAAAIDAMAVESRDVARLRAGLFESALRLLAERGMRGQTTAQLLGRPLTETSLRRGLEESLRALARLERDRQEQIALVDRANQVRPLTWI
jgi:serine/threonine-protein kinase PknG